jgi:hypothetical protein
MKAFRLFVLNLLVFIGVVSCQPEKQVPSGISPSITQSLAINPVTQTHLSSPTRTKTSTPTRIPSLTPTNTSIPLPELHTAGPYLFLNGGYGIFYELDGSGRRQINLPNDNGKFSPDMRWYAYITGDLDNRTDLPAGGVVLHILDIWNGITREVASLVPADFYKRQEQMTRDFLSEYRSHSDEPANDNIGINWAMHSLLLSMDTFSWSPDSRYLAFCAMVDGNSTDVYLYDIDTGVIQRKDNDLLNVTDIFWSTDGQWILHWNMTPTFNSVDGPNWDPVPLRAIRLDSSDVKISMPGLRILDWISNTEWLMTTIRRGDGGEPGSNNLFIINPLTGGMTNIWKGWWSGYAIDKQNKGIILSAEDPCLGGKCTSSRFGYYMGPIYGVKTRISDGKSIDLEFRGGTIHRFLSLVVDESDTRVITVNGISSDGTSDVLESGMHMKASISPNYRWLVIFGKNGITLFDESDRILFDWAETPVYNMAWKTNSQGLYFTSDDKIYYLSTDQLNPQLLSECYPALCDESSSFSLIPGVQLTMLPYLRVQRPSIEKQTQVTSIWSKATFKDLTHPGTNEYTINIPAFSDWRWDFSWCATTQSGLATILAPLNVEFYIGGEKIGEDIFRMYDHSGGGGYCRTWATLLSGWQPGDRTDLEIRYTLREAINDGTRVYPAGVYQQIIQVSVQ